MNIKNEMNFKNDTIMKKVLILVMAAMMSVGMMAEGFEGVACRDGQASYHWNKWLDYINIVEPLNIHEYETIYLCTPDISKVQWPEKSDNKYPALEQSLKAFPSILAKSIKKKLPGINVRTVNSIDEMKLDDKSLGICLRFEELDMGEMSLRVWVGAGAGAQKITLSGVIFDKDKNEKFDYRHRRVTVLGRSYKKDLQLEFANFGHDIAKMLTELSK